MQGLRALVQVLVTGRRVRAPGRTRGWSLACGAPAPPWSWSAPGLGTLEPGSGKKQALPWCRRSWASAGCWESASHRQVGAPAGEHGRAPRWGLRSPEGRAMASTPALEGGVPPPGHRSLPSSRLGSEHRSRVHGPSAGRRAAGAPGQPDPPARGREASLPSSSLLRGLLWFSRSTCHLRCGEVTLPHL